MVKTLPRLAGFITFLTLAVGWVVPAHAEGDKFVDPPDGHDGAGLQAVRIIHGERGTTVQMDFVRLVRSGQRRSQGVTVYVDSDRDRRGPERAMVAGLNDGSDWQIIRIRNWRTVGRFPLRCACDLDISWRTDYATAWISRGCLPKGGPARFAVVSSDDGEKDWLRGWRRLTRWLTRD